MGPAEGGAQKCKGGGVQLDGAFDIPFAIQLSKPPVYFADMP
jgi:hypothetical protein